MKNKFQITKVEIRGAISSTVPILVNNVNELIDHLENIGIESINICSYAPYDDSLHYIESDLSTQKITDEIFLQLVTKQKWQPFIVPHQKCKCPCIPKHKMIEATYLPIKESQLSKYFSNSEHIKYFKNSSNKYGVWKKDYDIKKDEFKDIRQIEKDERFWTTQTFIEIFEQIDFNNVKKDLKNILIRAFGKTPPLNFSSWDDALKANDKNDLVLKFEENIPSPMNYREYLSKNLPKRQFIPYILDWGTKADGVFRNNLEGPTHVDALIINKNTGFNLFIEAKVLSDISYEITYDVTRNQIARNIDVMTTDYKNHYEKYKFGLNDDRLKMESNNSLFILLTPSIFKKNPHSRLYGYKMESYKTSPLSLMADLSHRNDIEPSQWKEISDRISWLTWADIHKINRKCCPWVKK